MKKYIGLLVVFLMAGCLGAPSANTEQTAKEYIGKNAFVVDKNSVITFGRDLNSTYQLSVYSPTRPTGKATIARNYEIEFDDKKIDVTQTENSIILVAQSNKVFELEKNSYNLVNSTKKFGLYSLDESKCFTFSSNEVVCFDTKTWKEVWKSQINKPYALMVYNSKLLVIHNGLSLLEADTGKTIWSVSGHSYFDFEPIGFAKSKLIYKSESMSASVMDFENKTLFNVLPRDCNNAAFIDGYLWLTTRKNVLVKIDPETGKIIDSFYLFKYLVNDLLSMKEGYIDSFGSRILVQGTFGSAIIDPSNPKDSIRGLHTTHEIYRQHLPFVSQYLSRMDGKVYLDYEHSISGLDNNDEILAYDKNLLLTSNNGKLRLYKVE